MLRKCDTLSQEGIPRSEAEQASLITYTHKHTHKHTHTDTHINTHIHTHINTYIHTYIHTHINTHINNAFTFLTQNKMYELCDKAKNDVKVMYR